MIDLHSHIIPNVDDGSKSLDDSIRMIKKEIELGVSDIMLTPHYRRKMFETSKEEINLSFFNLKEEVKKQNLIINLYLGQEIYVRTIDSFKRILNKLEEESILRFENTKYILLEFSYTEEIDITEIVYMAVCKGYKPIIAHIERYQYIDSIYKVQEIMSAGALIQVNASSVIGKDGLKTKWFIKKLLKNDLIDVVSSDIHHNRVNYMKNAYDYVNKKYSKELADKIFEENAKKILGEIENE